MLHFVIITVHVKIKVKCFTHFLVHAFISFINWIHRLNDPPHLTVQTCLYPFHNFSLFFFFSFGYAIKVRKIEWQPLQYLWDDKPHNRRLFQIKIVRRIRRVSGNDQKIGKCQPNWKRSERIPIINFWQYKFRGGLCI